MLGKLRRFVRNIAVAASLGLAVTSCANPETAATAPNAAVDPALRTGYRWIAERYWEPLDLAALAVDGLNGLADRAPGFAARVEAGRIVLTAGGRTLGSLAAPGSSDIESWGRLLEGGVLLARANVPDLAVAGPGELEDAALTGLLAHLDRYSTYHTAVTARQVRARREGYAGIGVGVLSVPEGLRVEQVFSFGPAERSGLAVGDVITEVNGEALAGLPSDLAHDRLVGPIGSRARLTLVRAGRSLQVNLRRARVIETTVTAERRGPVLLLQISRFNAATAGQVRARIAELTDRQPAPAGLVIDLRGNPGGLLDQAIEVADLFLPRGEAILRTTGRHPESVQRYDSTTGDLLDGRPIVILVDGGSASASELLAAAMAENRRAVVIGATSMGKGSVQQVLTLPNAGDLVLTWSQMVGPDGRMISGAGVVPAVCSLGAPGASTAPGEGVRGRLAAPLSAACPRADLTEDEAALAEALDLIRDPELLRLAQARFERLAALPPAQLAEIAGPAASPLR